MTKEFLLPRSSWTAIPPKSTTSGEQIKGLDYFTKEINKNDIEFIRPGKEIYYIHRHPNKELNLLLKEQTLHTGLADIDYNYAITNTTVGTYVLRGRLNKCNNSETIKVLLLLGNNEAPSDTLKQNQISFLEHFDNFRNPIPTNVMQLGDINIHVFDLIELLIERKVYQSRNDGFFGPITEHAVKLLQEQKEVEITGIYNQNLREKLLDEDRDTMYYEGGKDF